MNLKELWMDSNGVRELPPVSKKIGVPQTQKVEPLCAT